MLKQLLANLFGGKSETVIKKPVRVLSPQDIPVELNKALQLHQSGQLEKAVELYEEIVENDPQHVDALHLLGLVKHVQHKNAEAIALLEQVLKINPSFTGAQVNLAVILRSELRYDESLAYFDKALLREPNHLEALFNRGNLLLDMGKPDDAIKNFDQYINIRKNNPDVFASKAIALFASGQYEKSLENYEQAIKLNKQTARYFFGRGNVLRELQRYDDAIQSYGEALQIQPDYAVASQNQGLTRLLVGDYKRGWQQYEARWNAELAAIQMNFAQEKWSGEPLENKKILLVAEQGYGDTIQFSRYIKNVSALGATIYLFIPKPLLSLFNHANYITRVFIEGEPLPDFDYYYPLMSLPLAFGTTIDTIPEAQSIFNLSDVTKEYWVEKINTYQQPRIGIFWQSTTPQKVSDSKALDAMVKTNLTLRNIPLTEFSIIFKSPFSFVSLQKDLLTQDKVHLKNYENVYDFSTYIDDFGDTAAIISQLDLVITIDTAVAHLAGMLGKPVWILLPFNADWRWLVHRNDSPWYATARLFRQHESGSWKEVLEEISQALQSL